MNSAYQPPAEFVADIVEHMNTDHADAVLNIARVFGGAPATAEAVMTGMDAEHLRLKIDNQGESSTLTVALPKALRRDEDVRPVLIKLARQAREQLGS